MATLVTYFSQSGNTKRVADAIAAACGGDIERIEETRNRTGLFGYIGAASDSLRKRGSDLRPVTRDPAQYDLVIVGTPVWAWGPTPAIRSYLMTHRAKIKRVAFFCTMGGAGDEGTFKAMAEICGCNPEATLSYSDVQMKADDFDARIREFVDALGGNVQAAA